MLTLLRSLAAHERCARNSESSANNHQTKRNVGESGLHPNPPFPSVDYPVKGSPINIPIFVGLSSVLDRYLEELGDLASYGKANTGSSLIMELPVSLYSIPGLWAAWGAAQGGPLTCRLPGQRSRWGWGSHRHFSSEAPVAGRAPSLRVLEEGALCSDDGQHQRHAGDHHVQPNRWPAAPGSFWSVFASNRHKRFL